MVEQVEHLRARTDVSDMPGEPPPKGVRQVSPAKVDDTGGGRGRRVRAGSGTRGAKPAAASQGHRRSRLRVASELLRTLCCINFNFDEEQEVRMIDHQVNAVAITAERTLFDTDPCSLEAVRSRAVGRVASEGVE